MFKPDGGFSDTISGIPLALPGRRLPDSSKQCVSTILVLPPECRWASELTCSSLYIAFRSNHPVLSARDGTGHCVPFVCVFVCFWDRVPLSTLPLEFEISRLSQEQRLPLAFSSTCACTLWAVEWLSWPLLCYGDETPDGLKPTWMQEA